MSNEINWHHSSTSETLYFTDESSAGLIRNQSGDVAFAVADWSTYAQSMTESPAASQRYLGSKPSTAAGKRRINIFRQVGASKAITDELLSVGELGWSVGAEVSLLLFQPDSLIYLRSATTGATMYAMIEQGSTVWNGSAMVAMATADWGTYDISLPETPAGSYRYIASIPSLPTGRYRVTVYLQAGASPAVSDAVQAIGEITVFTAATPKRTQILTSLSALLATITTANGFRTNVGQNVEEWDETPLDPDLETLRIEYRDESGEQSYEAVGEHLHIMPVTFRILCQNNTAGSALSTLRSALADLYQALYADVTLGGLCQDINQDGEARQFYGEKADRAAGAEIRYRIEYTTSPGSP